MEGSAKESNRRIRESREQNGSGGARRVGNRKGREQGGKWTEREEETEGTEKKRDGDRELQEGERTGKKADKREQETEGTGKSKKGG